MPANRGHVVDLERRYGRMGGPALDRLREIRASRGALTPDDVAAVAAQTGLPRAHLHGTATFYSDLGYGPVSQQPVAACAGTACFARTAGMHVAELERRLGPRVRQVACLGYCYASPAALDGHLARAGDDVVAQVADGAVGHDPPIPFFSDVDDPVALGGLAGTAPAPWSALDAIRRSAGAGRVQDEVAASGLAGRGGAAFPVARKWASARSAGGEPRFVVCNGDEGDPGSFVDRLLMEQDPHRVLEGLALAALAVGAQRGFFYVRSEYPVAVERLHAAVVHARAAGRLGPAFDVEVVVGAGSYVAGEETALIRALEGLRGSAALRPPYPTRDGLLGRPTAVNNVETLCAVPWILARGGAAYARRGTRGSRGTKLVSLGAGFARPGAYEVEFGVPLRHLCEIAGGTADGRPLRAVQIGGPLGGFLGGDELDVPLSYEGMRGAGVELGHAGIVPLGDRVTGVELLVHLLRFADAESCGACSPCRVGSRRGRELAERIASEGPSSGAMRELRAVTGPMADASLCGFGTGIARAVRSLVRVYADELEPSCA